MAFRRLANHCALMRSAPKAEAVDSHRAAFIWGQLYIDLGSAARDGKPIGFLAETDKALTIESMQVGEETFRFLTEPGGLLAPVESGWVCASFAKHNQHLNQSTRSREQRGGDARAFRKNWARQEGRIMQKLLQFNKDDRFKDADGQLIPSEQQLRIIRLICAIDTALFKEDRLAIGTFTYSDALIQNAYGVTRRYVDAQIDDIVFKIVKCRGHAVLEGMTAERLLAPMEGQEVLCLFDTILGKCGVK